MYFDSFVIMLTLGHSSLVMKNNHGFEWRAAISHNVEDNGGLPLVPFAAFGSAGHSCGTFEVIRITVEEFEREWCFVQIND
jgi:hypothetical protein